LQRETIARFSWNVLRPPHEIPIAPTQCCLPLDIVSRAGYSIAAASFPLELAADFLGWTPAAMSKGLVISLDQKQR
jgi:hypothetical protein